MKQTSSNSNAKEDVNSKLGLIADIPLIKNLSFILMHQLSSGLTEKSFKKNEYLIKQNDYINDIYLVLKGKFVISLNHNVQFDVEHDIHTFINYQNITLEPFSFERNHEITGEIKYKNEINLFIYDIKNFFGDIETLANYDKSLFSIKAAEDNSVIGTISRKNFLEIIDKVKVEFQQNVEEKLDKIQERIKDILNHKMDLNYDKLKVDKQRISYQLTVNHNYGIILEKINNIKKRIIDNNNLNQRKIIYLKQTDNIRNKKYLRKKNYTINDKNIINNIIKPKIIRSKSLLDINNYEKKVKKLFMFPTVLKNDTKIIFDKFFNDIYNRHKIKQFNLNEIKFDYEPIYINEFKNISKFSPPKKFDFLYKLKNHLEKKVKTPTHLIKNKSKIRQLVTMYNYYITNNNPNKSNSKLSGYLLEKDPTPNRSFGVLNPEIKKNLLKKPEKKLRFRKKPIKLDIIKVNSSFFDSYDLSKKQNIKKKIKSNKLFFNRIISEEIGKNSFNFNLKLYNFNSNSIYSNNTLQQSDNKNKTLQKSKEEKNKVKTNIISNKNRNRLSIAPNLFNNTIYKNVKIKTKNVFDILLKNKCESTKNHRFRFFQKNSDENNNNFDFEVNNNIDIKKEDFIKNFYSRNNYNRANTCRQTK